MRPQRKIDVLNDSVMRPARSDHGAHDTAADQLPFLVLRLVEQELLEIVEIHLFGPVHRLGHSGSPFRRNTTTAASAHSMAHSLASR